MSLVAMLMFLASAPQAATQSAPAAGDPLDRKVCKKIVSTGTIMNKRVCKTVREWDAERAAGKRALDRSPQYSGPAR